MLIQDLFKNKQNLELRNQLINSYLPFVNGLVKQFKYYPKILTREDLYQEGILGLMKALNNYRDFGYDFTIYAAPIIKFEITELIRKSHSPSLPQKSYQTNCLSFSEEKYNPHTLNYLNPHQLWLKQVNYEIFLKKIQKKISKNAFQIIRFKFGLPLGNIHTDYQNILTNTEIAHRLNLKISQINDIKYNAIQRLTKIYKKR